MQFRGGVYSRFVVYIKLSKGVEIGAEFRDRQVKLISMSLVLKNIILELFVSVALNSTTDVGLNKPEVSQTCLILPRPISRKMKFHFTSEQHEDEGV